MMSALQNETKMPLFEWNGNYYPSSYMKIENLLSLEKMEPKDGDIILTSYLRSGSMWTQAVIWSILNAGKPLPERLQVEFPYLELIDCNLLESMPSPRTFKSHMPYRCLPKSSSANYICIVRNIYDCCLSLFEFNSKNLQMVEAETYVSLDRHVELFSQGILQHGSYFDICQSWYEHKDDPNVLFLTYEEQKKDIRAGILKIAKFLGDNYYDKISSSPEILQQIIRNTGVDSMKEAKSYRFPLKGFSEALEKENENQIETVPLSEANTVPLSEANTFTCKDLVFKGEVGRARKGLSEKHRQVLRNALEDKIKSKELREILVNF